MVLGQDGGPGGGEVNVGQVFQDVSVIDGGVAIGDFDVTPAFERGKHHKEIGGAVALVLVVGTGRTPGVYRDRHAGVGDELFFGLVHAKQRAIVVLWPRVHRPRGIHRGDDIA